MTTKIKSGVISDNAITSAHISSGAISSAHLTSIDTDNITEGSSNLYFTTARVDSHLSGGTGVTYSSGAISIGQSVATSASPTFANLTLTGNLNITGDVDSVSVTDLDVTDKTITVGVGGTASANDGAGIVVDGASASILWDNSNDEWDINKPINVTGIVTADGLTVDGTGSFTQSSNAATALTTFTNSNAGASARASISFASDTGLSVVGTVSSGWTVDALNANETFMYGSNGVSLFAPASQNVRILAGGSEKMRIDSSGNVGIGVSSPDTLTHIAGAAGLAVLRLENTDSFLSDGEIVGKIEFETQDAGGAGVNAYIQGVGVSTNGATRLDFGTGGQNSPSTRMTINSNGNVGIGTTNPQKALDIAGASSSGGAVMRLSGTGEASQGDVTGAIQFYSADTTDNTPGVFGMLRGIAGPSGGEGSLQILTDMPSEGADASNITMHFNSNGNVGIGTSSPQMGLHVGSGTQSTAALAGIGIANGGSSYSFYSASDGTKQYIAGIDHNITYTKAGSLSNHSHSIITNNTNAIFIDTSQNVGIGTTSTNSFKTYIDATPGKGLFVEAGDGGYTALGWDGDGGATKGSITSNANSLYFGSENSGGTGSNGELRVIPGTGNVITLDGANSRVGIGTTSPASKLHILGPGGGTTTDLRICSPDNNTSRLTLAEDPTGDRHGAFFEYKGDDLDKTQIGVINNYTESNLIMFRDNTYAGFGSNLTNPLQNFVVGIPSGDNCDPPGLGNSTANFAILKRDASSSGNYGIITGISSDGNVWSQVQRVDGTATGYNLYLQPSGGSVGIGIPQNHTYIPNLIYPLRVGKSRSGTGNVTDYLTKIAIDAIGYGGSNYQMSAIDFTGGDTAGASGNVYGRIGCSSMNGANNQEEGSLEFFVRAPGYSMETAEAMKICGKAGTSIAGSGNSRNGVLFPFQGIAIDRTWANYPGIAVGNSSHYSSSSSTQAEFRFHGANFSSDSYPGTSGADFSVNVRTDGSFISTSDGRAKTNITTIDNALATVKQLTGKRFQRINRENEPQEHLSKNGYKFGFIAQEIEDIIPEAVQYHADEDDGTENWNSAYAMDYGSVVALLVNAIKEQDVVIQDLKTRIETLEG